MGYETYCFFNPIFLGDMLSIPVVFYGLLALSNSCIFIEMIFNDCNLAPVTSGASKKAVKKPRSKVQP